ncbi:MAG: YraN family protein [Oscillospiraceae bacterium]|jgi:putative endonuclease|nr:YraN family protein [Oscillospiraceae bacterium]
MSVGGDRKLLGRWGETLVAEDLRKKGCTILAAGWHCRFGEIDLIASDGIYLRFVEVKLRRDPHFAQAREFVDARKQEKLRLSAQLYLAENPTDLQPRFDVAEVYAPEGLDTRRPEIIYLENAFS